MMLPNDDQMPNAIVTLTGGICLLSGLSMLKVSHRTKKKPSALYKVLPQLGTDKLLMAHSRGFQINPTFLRKETKPPVMFFSSNTILSQKTHYKCRKNKKGSLDFLEQARVFNHGLLPRIHRPSARPGEEHGLASGPKRPLRPAPASRVPRFASPIRNQ